MLVIIILVILILFVLSIVTLVTVGLCIGIAYLMIFFIPTLGLSATLVPAAILTAILLITLFNAIKFLVAESIKNSFMPSSDDEPIQPAVSRNRSKRNKRSWY